MGASRKQAAWDRQRAHNDARIAAGPKANEPKRTTLLPVRHYQDPNKPWLSGDPAWDQERRNLRWESWDIYGWEPLPQDVLDIASLCDIDPLELDWHVEVEHGVEPHDDCYREAVVESAHCVLIQSCRAEVVAREPESVDAIMRDMPVVESYGLYTDDEFVKRQITGLLADDIRRATGGDHDTPVYISDRQYEAGTEVTAWTNCELTVECGDTIKYFESQYGYSQTSNFAALIDWIDSETKRREGSHK